MHGNLRVETKDDKAIRVLGVNISSISFWLKDNYKAEQMKFIFKKYGVDIAGQVCTNWSNFKSSQTLASILRAKAEKIRSLASHNERETENIGRYQQGGMTTILHNQLAAFVINSGSDHTWLGKWSWYLVEGEPGHRRHNSLRTVRQCPSRECTVYKQHERYIQEKRLKTN